MSPILEVQLPGSPHSKYFCIDPEPPSMVERNAFPAFTAAARFPVAPPFGSVGQRPSEAPV